MDPLTEVLKNQGPTVVILGLVVLYLRNEAAKWLTRYDKLTEDCRKERESQSADYINRLEKRDASHLLVLGKFNDNAGKMFDRMELIVSGNHKLSDLKDS